MHIKIEDHQMALQVNGVAISALIVTELLEIAHPIDSLVVAALRKELL